MWAYASRHARGPLRPPPLAVAVAVSPLTDLSFSLFVVATPAKHETSPWVEALRQENPALFAAVASFWPAVPACDEWTELLLIAQADGELFTPDPAAYLRRLGSSVPRLLVPELPSEEPDVRRRLQQRIDQLHRDTDLRERYADLVGRMGVFLMPYWENGARAEAEAMADDLRRRIPSATALNQFVPGAHLALWDRYRDLVATSMARDETVIVPTGLNPGGGFFFSFPGLLMISFGRQIQRFASERRKRGEHAANRFKVLSDATRMAFVNRLLRGQASVTDLAAYFEVSQPTASAHVKILRDAGLLNAERSGSHTLYRVDGETLQRFIDDAVHDLIWER